MSESQATPRLCRSPTSAWGSAPGTTTCRSRWRPGQVQRLGGLEELAVDAADAGEGVQVERERHAQRDQRDLRRLADAHPDDEQRDQPEVRQRAQHLHRRVDGVLADPAEAGDHGEHQADEAPISEAERRPAGPRPGWRTPSVPSRTSSTAAAADLRGARRSSARRDHAGAAEQLPERDQDSIGETQRRRKERRGAAACVDPAPRAGVGAGGAARVVVDMGGMSTELIDLNQVRHSTLPRWRVSRRVRSRDDRRVTWTSPGRRIPDPGFAGDTGECRPGAGRGAGGVRRGPGGGDVRGARGAAARPACWCRSSRCSARSRSTSAGWRTTRPATWRRCCCTGADGRLALLAFTGLRRAAPLGPGGPAGAGRRPGWRPSGAAGRRRGAGGRRGRPGDRTWSRARTSPGLAAGLDAWRASGGARRPWIRPRAGMIR